MTRLKRIAAYVWASPASLVGLAVVLPALLAGASARVTAGVIEVGFAMPRPRKRRIPFDAITFGHVVLGRNVDVLDRLRAHELVHVRQFERWGAFMLVAYPLSSLIQAVRGRNPYFYNYFEVQARESSTAERTRCS